MGYEGGVKDQELGLSLFLKMYFWRNCSTLDGFIFGIYTSLIKLFQVNQ